MSTNDTAGGLAPRELVPWSDDERSFTSVTCSHRVHREIPERWMRLLGPGRIPRRKTDAVALWLEDNPFDFLNAEEVASDDERANPSDAAVAASSTDPWDPSKDLTYASEYYSEAESCHSSDYNASDEDTDDDFVG